ncbi:MAG: hypothetical protein IPK32_24900 [Verrucomicrobiaceae bacterium]|nr:hypothetical protein [Verrucomicrobiaceae bacterium]
MNTLRKNRILLGWLMMLLVAFQQVATPLQAATVYWIVGTSRTSSGTWNATGANWTTVAPPTTPGAGAAWVNQDIAVFGNNTTSSFTVNVNSLGMEVGGLTFLNSGITLNSSGTPAAPTGSLVLKNGAATPVITLGSTTTTTAFTTNMNVALSGSNGLSIVTPSTTSTVLGRLVLGSAGGSNFANTLTGGITVGAAGATAKTSLEVYNRTSSAYNPLGTNQITLNAGSTLDLRPTASSATGLSGRVFDIPATSNTSRVDFTQTATGESYPSRSMLSTGAASQNVVKLR